MENEQQTNAQILSMYDVRGIQNYIFRTSALKDAIGASALVEDIFKKALDFSCKKVNLRADEIQLEWTDEAGPLMFDEALSESYKVNVLYIGGGNAYVVFESRELAIQISKMMSKYTMDNTYSLQLVVAMVEKTGNYRNDYAKLNEEMINNKAKMIVSQPIGALPIVEVERKTGFPLAKERNENGIRVRLSKESDMKKEAGIKKRKADDISREERIFDNYTTKKGDDSMIAVVHIDGNNMGNRIRTLVENIESYDEAINLMREISFQIDSSYKNVFEKMRSYFNKTVTIKGKTNDFFVLKILTAGDDITYVCNAKIAVQTVEFFANEITKYGMRKDIEEVKYKFSVCGGISFINSHFPFNIGYEVAEECCSTAKDRAKETENKKGSLVGNWVDFQICKNIQTLHLSRVRHNEYITKSKENLLIRPYYIPTESFDKEPLFKNISDSEVSLKSFKEKIKEVNGIQRTFAKQMRNTYPLGEEKMRELTSFLNSRGVWKKDLYIEPLKIAKYYDALEMLDYYVEV